MPRVFGNLFHAQMAIMGRVQRFLSSVEQRLTKDGRFLLGSGQALEPSYRYYDPATRENVWLWRTAKDEAAQEKYRKYRKVVDEGMHAVLRDIDPELYETVRKDKREQRVRAYDLLTLLSNAYTNIACGGGVTIKTKIEKFDSILKGIKLEQKWPQWMWEASVYSYVGIQVAYDPDSEAFDVVRILPDHLYVVRDQINTDEIDYIAKRIWLPMESVVNWKPIQFQPKCLDGINAQPANGVQFETSRAGAQGGADANSVMQDGFVFEEKHYRGWIEYAFYAVSGNRIMQEVPLNLYDADLARSPVYFTGMRDFAITILANVANNGHWKSDWDGVFDAVVDFNIRATKNSRLVDKYSAPTPIVPSTHIQVDPYTGKARWGHSPDEVIVARPTDKIMPSFLQPNANFDAPTQDLEFSLSMIGLLAQARYAVDPEVIEQIDTGVALKLKMSPTIAYVATRKEASKESLRTLIWNLMSAIEYYTSDEVNANDDPKKQDPAGVVFSGELYKALIEQVKTDKLNQIRRGRRISLEDMQPIFATVTLTDDDSAATKPPESGSTLAGSAGQSGQPTPPTHGAPPNDAPSQDAQGDENPEEKQQKQDAAVPPSKKKEKVTGVLPWSKQWGDPEKSDEGGFQQGKQSIGPNTVPSTEMAMIKLDDLQRQLDALHVMDLVISSESLEIRLASGLPQDHAEAATRTTNGTMSLFRLLTEFDGLSENEAQKEIQRISDDLAGKAPTPNLNGAGTDTFSLDDPDKLQNQEDAQKNKDNPPVPGANDQNDQIGTSTQQTGRPE